MGPIQATTPPAPAQAAANPASQVPRPDLTANMPAARAATMAQPHSRGFGALQNQANRPQFYGGNVTINGNTYQYGTGGGEFASLPYGTYYLHPGAIGPVGRRIGSIAGISDSNRPGDNTVHDPLYRGSGGTNARAGVEVHFSASGHTNGCFGIRNNWGGFQRDFASAARRGPLTLTIRPDGSASIDTMGAAQVASAAQPTRQIGRNTTTVAEQRVQ